MTANLPPKNFWKKLITRFVVYVSIFALTSQIIFPFTLLLWKQNELSRAKQQWVTTKPATYQVTVSSRNFIQESDVCHFYEPYVITVADGKVVDSNAPVECKTEYEQLTIENSFIQIEHYLKSFNPILTTKPRLRYDASYNFVSYFYISNTDSIFSTDFVSTSISYKNFQVVETLTTESLEP